MRGRTGKRLLRRLEGVGRKPATLEGYQSLLRIHLVPFFGEVALGRISPSDIEQFLAAKRAEGRAPKTIRNALIFLNSIYVYAERHGLVSSNPVPMVDKPRTPERSEVRFLDETELEALLRSVPDDVLGRVEGPLYVTAAMTGLRMGELLGLRWEASPGWRGDRPPRQTNPQPRVKATTERALLAPGIGSLERTGVVRLAPSPARQRVPSRFFLCGTPRRCTAASSL